MAVMLGFTVLTGVMAWPLVQLMGTGVVGMEGDNFYSVRQLWWVKHALLDLRTSPFFDASSYYPAGHRVAHGELSPAVTLPAIPITAVWGPLPAYNLTLFLSFVLMGLGTYYWVRRLTGDSHAGFLAGAIAAFLPYRFAHLSGHLNIVSTHWMPWALCACEQFIETRRMRWAIGLGLFVALVALSSWYYAYSVAIILPLYMALRCMPSRAYRHGRWWQGLACGSLLAAVIVLPFIVPYLQLRSEGGLTRGIGEMDSWSLNFYDFFLPNLLHPLWTEWMIRHFPHQSAEWADRGVSLGYTAIGLGIVGLVSFHRHPAVKGIALMWLFSYLIALGPTLHSGDRAVLVSLPDRAIDVFGIPTALVRSAPAGAEDDAPDSMVIPLPSLFLWRFVPLTSGMRFMGRFAIWTGLFTAALAGWGLCRVIVAGRRRPGAIIGTPSVLLACVVLLTLFESWGVGLLPRARVQPRPVDRWLATQPRTAIVELPLDQARRPLQDYYKTVHQQPTLFGPTGDGWPPPELVTRITAVRDFPSSRSIDALRDWDVRFVLLNPSQISTWSTLKAAIDKAPGLRYDRTIDGVLVYRLTRGPD